MHTRAWKRARLEAHPGQRWPQFCRLGLKAFVGSDRIFDRSRFQGLTPLPLNAWGVPKQEGKLMRKQNLTMMTMFGALLAVLPARAVTIATHTGGISTVNDGSFFVGQSFTTPAGGPWNHITFNFFSDNAGMTATADGTLYIFNSAYTGTPADLSLSRPLAKSTGVSNGAYIFDPAFTLEPNMTYYAYSDTNMLGFPGVQIAADSSGSGLVLAFFESDFVESLGGDSADF